MIEIERLNDRLYQAIDQLSALRISSGPMLDFMTEAGPLVGLTTQQLSYRSLSKAEADDKRLQLMALLDQARKLQDTYEPVAQIHTWLAQRQLMATSVSRRFGRWHLKGPGLPTISAFRLQGLMPQLVRKVKQTSVGATGPAVALSCLPVPEQLSVIGMRTVLASLPGLQAQVTARRLEETVAAFDALDLRTEQAHQQAQKELRAQLDLLVGQAVRLSKGYEESQLQDHRTHGSYLRDALGHFDLDNNPSD